jgi:hypothetical protein
VNIGVMVPVVGMKPEKKPRVAGWMSEIGIHGLLKVD